jgi:hypothetical protein
MTSVVRQKYRQACSKGFDGFLDELAVEARPSFGGRGPESGAPQANAALHVRGWGKVAAGRLRRVLCYEVPSDTLAGTVDAFFARGDLSADAQAFDVSIRLSPNMSSRYWDYAFLAEANDGRLFPLFHHSPKNVQIELDGRCNLACVMCPQAFGVHSGPLSSADLVALRPVIEDSECVEINHQGESLLSPRLLELLRMVPPHKQIAFNCNGTALKGRAAKQLLEYAPPVRFISISIDAGTEQSFFRIRGTSLRKIIENAKAFKAARDAAGLSFPQLAITCTVIREFMIDVPAIVEIASQLDGLFRYWPLVGSGLHGGGGWVTPFKGSDELFVYDDQVPRDGAAWRQMAGAIQLEAERLGVVVIDPFQYSWSASSDDEILQPNKGEGVSACPLIHRQRFFNANGNAQMCCVQTSPMFNWREFGPERFDEHPAVIAARSSAKAGIIPDACSGAACSYIAGQLAPCMKEKPLTYIQRGFI